MDRKQQIAEMVKIIHKGELDRNKGVLDCTEFATDQENGKKNEKYWKGKLSAFKQIRAYIDAELEKKYTEESGNDR